MLVDYKSLIKNRNFLYLWFSQILSQLAIHILNFTLLIRIYSETNSTIATSFLWVVYALPAVFVGPVASASVDLFNRKKILMFTNLAQALTILLYAVTHTQSLFLIYTVALLYSLFNQFYVPAELASLPSVTKEENLPYANGLFFITQQAALIVGFGVAGLILNYLGLVNTLYVCSIFLFFAFISVSFLPRINKTQTFTSSFEETIISFFRRIVEGYNFIKEDKRILYPFSLIIILQISLAVIAVNAPIIATDIFNIQVNLAGIGLVVPAGLGAAVGAVIIARMLREGVRKKKLIQTSLILVGLVMLLITFLVPVLNQYLKLVIGTALIAALGFAFVGILIPSQTFLQEKTPGGLRGRVFGNIWFMSTIFTIFPVIISGAVTELLGAQFITFIFSFVYVGIFLYLKKHTLTYLQKTP